MDTLFAHSIASEPMVHAETILQSRTYLSALTEKYWFDSDGLLRYLLSLGPEWQ